MSAAAPDPQVGWVEALRSRGLRATGARLHVLAALAELGHATPEQLFAGAGAGINLSTIYRTLDVLSDHDLVSHTHLDHASATYMLASHASHAHLVCRECHVVLEVDPTLTGAFAGKVESRHGFSVDTGHLSVFGLCASCAEGSQRA